MINAATIKTTSPTKSHTHHFVPDPVGSGGSMEAGMMVVSPIVGSAFPLISVFVTLL